MATQTLHIKNMICPRCIKVVTDELENIGLNVASVRLGYASFEKNTTVSFSEIKRVLGENGFEIIESENQILVEKIKHAVIDLLQNHHEKLNDLNFPTYLSEKTGMPYRLLSRIFSTEKKMTIERYIILEKIEKAKELLDYGEKNQSEIADYLGYKTVQHLSNQFKSVTGKSALQFQKQKTKKRRGMDEV